MEPQLDIGQYHLDEKRVEELETKLYKENPPITFPPEYAEWTKENLLRFTIRLARYKFVARMVSPQDRVLEVGCGSGLGSIFVAQHAAHVTGLDVKSYELEEANSLNRRDNVEFVEGDFFDHKPADPYDVVMALDVIEHMPVEQGSRFIQQMANSLVPTGTAIIGTPSIYSYPHQSPISQASHVKCYDRDELMAVARKSFGRVFPFGMTDELLHTGHPKMTWYYFLLCTSPIVNKDE